ncbi:hypothetical protein KY285_010551 [Solanum tuberosum]|nr:hypothetical protein KY285_010551 [Solanum tuberosum]
MAFCPYNRKNDQTTLFRAQKSLTNGTLPFQQGEGPNYSILNRNRQKMAPYPSGKIKGPSYFEPDNRQSMVLYPSNQTKGSDYSISSSTNQLSTALTPYNWTKGQSYNIPNSSTNDTQSFQ